MRATERARWPALPADECTAVARRPSRRRVLALTSRSVCLPSVGEAHMGVIFFMATLEPVCTFLQATTMP